ncbi:hypothetical protein BGZ70_008999 [Mortierella alpina]|uniref:Uncharacterized protein n=1 Tax=Mortierella alpina TaxID=64518 RepID=A0A9P6J2Q6_MORAP|nr:hypothetical protein BGZ70_008999 [Mortierella alpina]
MPPKVATTRSRASAPAASAAGPSTAAPSAEPIAPVASAASAAASTSRSSVTFPDATTAHTHDDTYDEDAIMEDVAAMTSTSGNEVQLPSTPGRLQEEDDEDLLEESNEFADNLVEGLHETDDALLAALHLEREELV